MCHHGYCQGCIESHRDERACNFPCSVLKCQNSYEFIHNLINSNNMQEFMGVYWLRWRSLSTRALTYEKTQGLGWQEGNM